MNTLTNVIQYLLPLLALALLLLGLGKKRVIYIQISLWLALIALLLEYKYAGNEILGTYFDYNHAALYSLALLILLVDLLYIGIKYLKPLNPFYRIAGGFLVACLVTGSILLMVNLWVNAQFIENRFPNTAILQVVTFTPPAYCLSRYIYYKVGTEGKVYYLCPNHYGLIPSIGHLDVVPEFIARQLTAQHKRLDKQLNQDNGPIKQ
ncbi:hypothetical protein [Legionella londiniensis]|uniref:Type I secretion system LssZ n=1 Tax=Legionella londiniensis TaxID=45068 RepID=A0A0W0VNJ9_9GAMM|nr:hypothetical protein [Legionella londiniensis]KTD21733.1 type I secretion system LssZ [Legionella londiniensis]STX93430.1 type I secretion system LssZ [Legionella londiniensis]